MKRTGFPNLAFIICCCLALSLAACGQRGPLYLPEPEEQIEPTEAVIDAEESAEDDSEESSEPLR